MGGSFSWHGPGHLSYKDRIWNWEEREERYQALRAKQEPERGARHVRCEVLAPGLGVQAVQSAELRPKS